MSLRVLVVEDDREIRALMQTSLAVEGFEVQTQAVAYAPTPTKAAWPNDVTPATPVSITSPAATSA